MDWKRILRTLDACCADHKINDSFRDAVRVKLFEKALMPVVGIEPTSLDYASVKQKRVMRIKWNTAENLVVVLLVYLQSCAKPFVVAQCNRHNIVNDAWSFDTEQRAAEEVCRLLKTSK